MANQITDMTLTELSQSLESGKVSAVEATKDCLKRISETSELNNFITVCEAEALDAACAADKMRKANKSVNPLCGVPLGIKDNIVTKSIKTTCASKMLENFVPPYDAFVVEKLKRDGAVILGKTNMDEFAMGSTSENSAFGAPKNAAAPKHVTGGSSGGSASCVAAKQAFGALGSDTGGSIRQPASFCGVYGLKPTYSAVSRYGLIAFASSLDQIGPFARSADDLLTLFKSIIGKDNRDSTSTDKVRPLPAVLKGNVKGKTVGIVKEFFSEGLDGGVRAQIEKAVDLLKSQGAAVKEVSIASFSAALATYYVLSSAEAASNLARYDGVKYGARAKKFNDIIDLYYQTRTEFFGDEVKRRIMIGNYVLSSGYYDAYYLKAQKIRTVIKKEFEDAFKSCDVLISPVSPVTAPKLGRKVTDTAQIYLADAYTVPINIAGLPAVSVPFGTHDGLPVGVQLIADSFNEQELFEFAKCLEVNNVKGI